MGELYVLVMVTLKKYLKIIKSFLEIYAGMKEGLGYMASILNLLINEQFYFCRLIPGL